MRINKFVALSTGMSRRAADIAIADGHILVNNHRPEAGYAVHPDDTVTYNGSVITPATAATVMLNKPTGYVVSRDGQGSKTVYDILPPEYANLKPVGRLDKNSSGLLLLTNDGELAHELTHPSNHKLKIYEIMLDKPLQPLHRQMIGDFGVELEDGVSKLGLERQTDGDDTRWIVQMSEGRNRQIRRTFSSLGYEVIRLHRTHFGPFTLDRLKPGAIRPI